MEKFLNKDIELLEPEHKYILKAEPDLNFTSVTSITSQYFAPFNKDAIAKRLVETNMKYIGMTMMTQKDFIYLIQKQENYQE